MALLATNIRSLAQQDWLSRGCRPRGAPNWGKSPAKTPLAGVAPSSRRRAEELQGSRAGLDLHAGGTTRFRPLSCFKDAQRPAWVRARGAQRPFPATTSKMVRTAALLLSLVVAGADATWLRWTAGDRDAPWMPALQTGNPKDARCREDAVRPQFPPEPTAMSPPEAALELRQAKTTGWVNSNTCGWYGTDSCKLLPALWRRLLDRRAMLTRSNQHRP